MTDTSHVVKSFIANTIDVYDDITIQGFIVDSKLNLEKLITHPLTKLNIAYNFVWHTLYGVYATKKDFTDFETHVIQMHTPYNGNLHHILNNTSNLFDKILAHEPFTLCRMGVLGEMLKIAKEAFIAEAPTIWEDRAKVLKQLEKKWQHRFCGHHRDSHDQSILKTFLKHMVHGQNALHEVQLPTWDHVSGFYSDDIQTWQPADMQYMSSIERIQYRMFRDNRFLLQLATRHVVVQDDLSDTAHSVVSGLVEALTKDMHKNVLHILVTSSSVQQPNKVYTMHPYIMQVCPKIASYYTLITSNQHHHTLCRNRNIASLVVVGNEVEKHSTDEYGVVYTTSDTFGDPINSTYFIPSSTTLQETSLQPHLIIRSLWKQYLSVGKCPFKANNPRLNGMLYTHFIGMYVSKHASDMVRIMSNYTCKPIEQSCTIVVVDSRYNMISILACLITLYNIIKHRENQDIAWKVRIYTSRGAVEQYEEYIRTLSISPDVITVETHDLLEVPIFSLETYNEIMKDAAFWDSMDTESCIIVQDDGMLINGHDIKAYMKYDYVGAPWVDAPDNAYIKSKINPHLVGNGGFSLRNVRKMSNICQKFVQEKRQLFFHNINEIPEDIYFVKYLVKDNHDIAPFEVARKFSVEQVPCLNAVGFHKFWLYHSPKDSWTLFTDMLN